MIASEVKLLMRKEWRQLRTSKQAMATSVLMPFLFLLVLPQVFVFASQAAIEHPPSRPPPDGLVGLLGDVTHDPTRIAISFLPLFCGLAGLTVPTILAIHAVVSERESRTFELLLALPVRVSWVLEAKLLTILSFTTTLCGALLSVSAIEMLVLGIATPLEVLALYLELVAAIGAGAAGALVVGFHSHDFRTAQNVSGAVIAPMVLVSIAVSMLVGGGAARPLALAVLYGALAAGFALHAARQRTFEKLLR